ncbi:hypothetical protein K6L44_12000 [Gluconacetobacter entanii]|uniref:Uncharacterized protein n=1 Tax=Gluconacetobacter entanii TaxID=108528 RepID=A0A318PSJ4_9PROT|nr:hypothetical protein [Gluconacetobacter entanii]MBE7620972.1 hypothetical protein [Komagataeibacter sp. FXV2]MCE2578698.1 hypothetical protein [Komagataeibacter sp. FNDCR1]MBY4640693.1 hypothetical protein [Gluconacetobacter entanii]MCW4579599.1 hypothetical protein [Gluconacetobacter entanii]MCW4583005.1 hypothetical protein [Gluconacetobacter entanii]
MPDHGDGASPQHALEAVLRGHRDVVVAALLDLACHASSEATRLAALKEMLDRGWGKVAASSADTPPAPGAPTLLIAPALLRPAPAAGQDTQA